MTPRIVCGRFLILLGRFIQSLAIMVMRPKDLIEFSRLAYWGQNRAKGWGTDKMIEMGLNPAETLLLDKIPLKQGRLLVLGVGGGREAIFLAQRNYEVTGLDFIPEMVQRARENALKKGLALKGLVQEMSRLEVPKSSFDIVWLSAAMYSCIPTKMRRIEMLKRIKGALKTGGYFACQFHFDEKAQNHSKIATSTRRLFAWLTLGNLRYEPGDALWNQVEFIHAFSQERELISEFEVGGFKMEYFHTEKNRGRGEALLSA